MAGSKEYNLAIKIAGKVDASFNKALGHAQGSVSKLKSFGVAAAKVGAAAIAAAGAATVAFAKSSIDAGRQFDAAMSQVASTMGKTVGEITDLREKAIEMGSKTSFSATQAAEGLNILAMAGLNSKEQIAGIETVLNLAAAGAIEMGSAASYVVGSVKGFSDSMDNAQYYADLIAKGATLANTSVDALGTSLSMAAATASTYGQQADSVTLSLLRLAEQNVTGEEAANGLNRAMADIYTPTAAAKKALDALGISAYDSSGRARDFNTVVNELSVALSGMTQEEANATAAAIFTTRGLNTFNKMATASTDTLNRFQDGLENSFGAAAQQAATQLDNLEGDITIFKSALEGLQIRFSDYLTPAIRAFTQAGTRAIGAITERLPEIVAKVTDLANRFTAYALPKIEDFKTGAINAFNAVKPTLETLWGIISGGISKLIQMKNAGAVALGVFAAFKAGSGLISLIKSIEKAQAALKLLGTGMNGVKLAEKIMSGALSRGTTIYALFTKQVTLSQLAQAGWAKITAAVTKAQAALNAVLSANPWMIVIAAIAAVVAVIIVLYKKCEWFRNGVNAILQAVAGFFQQLWEKIKGIAQSIGAAFQTAWGAVVRAYEWASPYINAAISVISGAVSEVVTFFKDSVIPGVKQALQAMAGAFLAAWDLIKTIWSAVEPFFLAIWEAIKAIFSVVAKVLGAYFKAAWSAIKVAWKAVKPWFSVLWAGIKAIFSVVGAVLSGFFRTAWEAIKAIWNAAVGYFTNVWNSIAAVFSVVKSVLSGDFAGAWSAIKDVLSGWKNYFSDLWSSVKNIFSNTGEWFRNTFSTAWNGVKSVVGTALDAIKSTFSTVFNSVKSTVTSIFDAIYNKIKDKIEGARDKVKAAIDKIKGFFNFSWSLPSLKLPHISITGKWGFNPPSYPKFSISWYKQGGILDGPQIFGASGGKLLGGGEAGKEAVLPLDLLWAKLENILNATIGGRGYSENRSGGLISTVMGKLDEMNAWSRLPSLEDLLDGLKMALGQRQPVPAGGPEPPPAYQIQFSPTYQFYGPAPSKEDMVDAARMSQEEFNEMMARWIRDNDRKRF